MYVFSSRIQFCTNIIQSTDKFKIFWFVQTKHFHVDSHYFSPDGACRAVFSFISPHNSQSTAYQKFDSHSDGPTKRQYYVTKYYYVTKTHSLIIFSIHSEMLFENEKFFLITSKYNVRKFFHSQLKILLKKICLKIIQKISKKSLFEFQVFLQIGIERCSPASFGPGTPVPRENHVGKVPRIFLLISQTGTNRDSCLAGSRDRLFVSKLPFKI